MTIDSELGHSEPKGEDWAKELYSRGFQNIFLATGHNPDYFKKLPWIKGIIGKEAPWEK